MLWLKKTAFGISKMLTLSTFLATQHCRLIPQVKTPNPNKSHGSPCSGCVQTDFEPRLSCYLRPPSQEGWVVSKIPDKGGRRDGSSVKSTHCSCNDSSLIPSTHIRLLTFTCNFSSKRFNTLFWATQEPVLMCTYLHTETRIHTSTHNSKTNKNQNRS